jgi:hypothetical protein
VTNAKLLLTFSMVVFFLVPACTGHDGTDRKPVFQQVPELKTIKQEKPVKIKLKRGSSGNYSWEISGYDADRVIDENNKLKKSVEKDE